MEQSFLWYDLETFGRNPFHDRIAQFAAIRTNHAFEQIGEPVVLYCRPSPDYLPDPESCLITGITPQDCMEQGIPEYEFASAIFAEMTRPGTTVLGYNSISFDDEFIRNLFYRNLYDPYVREYANGNSRWDILPLARATRDLRPEGLVWPVNDEGKPQFKLEILAAANGIEHEHAHDALSDVRATMGLAKLIRDKQPRLFGWYFSHRKKDELRKLFDLNIRPALVYTSPLLTRKEGTSTIICPIGVPGENARQGRDTLLCVDLRYDPREILDLDVEELKTRVFLPKAMEDSNHRRFPVYTVKINKAPCISPLKTLSEERAAALGIDIDLCLQHREVFLKNRDLTAKFRQVFNSVPESRLPDDPDYQIYKGFFADEDKDQFSFVHRSIAEIIEAQESERSTLIQNLIQDIQRMKLIDRDRIQKLINRILGRSFGRYLPSKVKASWKDFCQNRLIFPLLDEARDIHKFEKEIRALMKQSGLSAGNKIVLKRLLEYFDVLKGSILEVK